MTQDISVDIGSVRLKNPLICGSGEHLIERAGIQAALEGGAAAVVMKSTNESLAAKEQLRRADYVFLDTHWRALSEGKETSREASFFCRSGLSPLAFDEWLALLSETDSQARDRDAYVIASLIPADIDRGVEYAAAMAEAGARILELNIGAPHAGEAAAGAITLEREASRVTAMTRRVRDAVKIPLWVKLTGQSEDVAALALAAKEGGADAVTLMGRFMGFVPDIERQAPVLNTFAAIGGAWALPLTCRWLALARRLIGPSFPLMATNGARDGLDVVRFALAGASATQMTSAVMAGGKAAVDRTLKEIAGYVDERDERFAALVGRAADRLEAYHEQAAGDAAYKHWLSG